VSVVNAMRIDIHKWRSFMGEVKAKRSEVHNRRLFAGVVKAKQRVRVNSNAIMRVDCV